MAVVVYQKLSFMSIAMYSQSIEAVISRFK